MILPEEEQDLTLDLPRILCLHGGGVNARIFRQQSRGLIKQLKPHFRLVFADGPFFCKPGPGMVPVYEEHGPFRRWMRWLPEQPECDARTAAKRIDRQIKQAMDEDDEQGATGEWVGLLGFSQGAKIAASMLFMQQKRAELLGANMAGTNFRFAVIMAGRAPLVTFDPQLVKSPGIADLADISVEFPEGGLVESATTYCGCRLFMSTGVRTRGCICTGGCWISTVSQVVRAWSSGMAITGYHSSQRMLR
ncbi:MAG: hypothetical protein OHK93_001130 [Ramalina farinacea]|uniref:Serine hydrolase domain-containing protein n=1 Tax=Ramalina farinacea TaxID=258253 RepID=A0AA43TSJ9_9LECA|nr:hypothetical protein [Ramalina farinacea]